MNLFGNKSNPKKNTQKPTKNTRVKDVRVPISNKLRKKYGLTEDDVENYEDWMDQQLDDLDYSSTFGE